MASLQWPSVPKQFGQSKTWNARVTVVAVSLILLTVLAACNSPAAHTNGASSTKTVPAGQPSATAAAGLPTPTPGSTPLPTSTPNLGGFQVTFSDQYTAAVCSGASAAGTVCVTTSGSGNAKSLGNISLARTSVYTPGASGACYSATTTGTITLATTGTVTFTGSGTFCPATEVANFTYSFTGGTGQYQQATGAGTIYVPVPTSSSSGTEVWSGTLYT